MPTIPFAGFCGPSYQYENNWATVERLSNWYTIANESAEDPKFKLALARSPGNKSFSTLPVPAPFNKPNRGLIENRGRVFGVNGNVCFEIDENGVMTNLGPVAMYASTDPRYREPVSMTANGNGQVFFTSAGKGYVITNGVFTLAPPDFLGGVYCTFQDGYIIAVQPDSNTFQISGDDDNPLGDARIWSQANIGVLAGQADKLRACISSREYLRFLGARRSEVWQSVGNNGIGGFPFQNYNQTFIETGLGATFSLADLGDSLVWVGQDFRGIRACWRDHGFSPQRISNFAVEQFWQTYDRIDDAVGFPYIWKGHLIYRITFPSAYESTVRFPLGATSGALTSATWEYDATVSELVGRSIWNERSYLTGLGNMQGRPELYHCFAFGKHLVGSAGVDGNPGAIYEMSDEAFTDCGTDADGTQTQRPIVRDRICPIIYNGNNRVIFDRIQFDLMRGVGLDGDPDAVGADPQLYLRWSNDAGKTFGPEYNIPVGRIGDYGRMVYYDRGGYGRQRVYWIRYTDPTDQGLVGAMLTVRPCKT